MVLLALFLNLNVLVPFQAAVVSRTARMAKIKMIILQLCRMRNLFVIIIESIIKRGMIGTPGIIKFFWPKDNVEVKYNSIYDIPIMDINKKIIHLDPTKDSNVIFVHIKDAKTDLAAVQTIQQKAKASVYILPDQNSPESFEEIRKLYPNALGKMIVNGPDAHPLAKLLRKNSYKLYDFQMFGAHKAIPMGVFQVKGEQISYYSGQSLTKFIASL